MPVTPKEFFAVLDELNVEIVATRHNKHTAVRCKAPDGHFFTTAIPATCSDTMRAVKKFRAQVKGHIAGVYLPA